MKKTFLSIAIVVAFVSTIQSQGFIDWHWQNYYFNDIPIADGMEYPQLTPGPLAYYYNTTDVFTEFRQVDTQMTVYGIAISSLLFPSPYFEQMPVLDTSHEGWHEYARLYKPVGDSMILLGEGQYNMFDRPAVYLPTNKRDRVYDSASHRYVNTIITVPIPIFETYFDSAIILTDSFYIGSTHFNTTSGDVNGNYLRYPSWIPELMDISYSDTARVHTLMQGDSIYRWYRLPDTNYTTIRLCYTVVCYPILTPNPNHDTTQGLDTTQIDTTQVDTTGIAARLLERYINVYPTVTDGGEVTVLSSFHLEGVEVYDAAGRMLSRQPASGVATTVDVSQLPAGSYVLRINTVSGSTTKKFLKR